VHNQIARPKQCDELLAEPSGGLGVPGLSHEVVQRGEVGRVANLGMPPRRRWSFRRPARLGERCFKRALTKLRVSRSLIRRGSRSS